MYMEIINFIRNFYDNSSYESVKRVFTCGCCYWFAYILLGRFSLYGAEIMYDPVENHFVTMILGRCYDITGDVTDKYSLVRWLDFDDEIERKRIVEQCINYNDNESVIL